MPNFCKYSVQLNESAISYEKSVVRVLRLVRLYCYSDLARSDDGQYRSFVLSSPFGSTLLWSNKKRELPRIDLVYRDGEACAFSTDGARCVLALATLLTLGHNPSTSLSFVFSGEMPTDEVMLTASHLAWQVCRGLTCPPWFPRRVFYGGSSCKSMYPAPRGLMAVGNSVE